MQSTLFVLGFVVLAAVLVKQGDSRSLEIRDLLLGELQEDIREELNSLLGRELESSEEQSSETHDRRWPGWMPQGKRINRNKQQNSNGRRVIGNGHNSGSGSSNSDIKKDMQTVNTQERRQGVNKQDRRYGPPHINNLWR